VRGGDALREGILGPGGSGLEGQRPEEISPIAAVTETVPTEAAAQEPAVACKQTEGGTRRSFLGRSARKLAYVSPVVLLLRPRPACASRIYS